VTLVPCLFSGIEPVVPIEYENLWVMWVLWIFWRRGRFLQIFQIISKSLADYAVPHRLEDDMKTNIINKIRQCFPI
jgi:hypothetical protein